MEPLRLSSLLFVVLAAVISVVAGVTPFEEQFLSADPENLGSRGNKFYVAFPQNVPRGPTDPETDAYIIVSTTESDVVQFNVTTMFGGTETNTYEVRYNQTTRVVFSPDAYYVRNRDQRDRGILVKAEDGKTISVYVVNDEVRSTDGYLALSCDGIQNPNNFNRYQYLIFSTAQPTIEGEQRTSQFLLVPCTDNTVITVTPSQELSGSGIFDRAEFGPGIPAIWRGANEGETLLITHVDDLTGTLISSNRPIVVISGHQCGQIPPGQTACDHLAEQIPPHTTWGYTYLLNPLALRESGDYYRFATNLDNTEVTITCVNESESTPVEVLKETLNKEQRANWGRYETHPLPCTNHSHDPFIRKYCCLQATNPVLVAQYSYGYTADNPCIVSQNSDPFMSLVPPVTQYLNKYTITLIDAEEGIFPDRYVGVVVHQSFFSPNRIMMDDMPLESDEEAWQGIYCADGSICGYAISKEVDAGNHTIYHSMENAALYVHMYGFQNQNSYGFPAGMELEKIAGTVISCAPPATCLDEDETFTVTCTRSLDTTLVSIADIMSEDGTATESDYKPISIERFRFAPQETEYLFNITTEPDDLDAEPIEDFYITFIPRRNALFLPPRLEIQICGVAECSVLEDPPNGRVEMTGRAAGDTATYTCNTGFQLIGAGTVTCQTDGEWSDPPPTCQRIECPDLTDPANGVVVMTGNSVGDTATFTCNSGFELVGAATVTCQDDRQWSDLPSACQIVIDLIISFEEEVYTVNEADGEVTVSVALLSGVLSRSEQLQMKIDAFNPFIKNVISDWKGYLKVCVYSIKHKQFRY